MRPTPIEKLLAALGDTPFTTETAHSAGLTNRHMHELMRSGHVRRLLKGVYVAATTPDRLDLRVAAMRLHVPPRSVVCDRHAAWLIVGGHEKLPGDGHEAARWRT